MIKLIATDMDGTWLDSKKEYDHDLFLKEFKIMQERKIKFVAASGNQYDNLLTRFPDVKNEMYFIAENGALVAKGTEILHVDNLSDAEIKTMQKIAADYNYNVIWSGLQAAYILRTSPEWFIQEMHKYFKKLELVDDFSEIDDRMFKMSLFIPEGNASELADKLRKEYSSVEIVTGSDNEVDIQKKGITKVTGLKYLGKKLHISAKEMVAFGDSGNDVSMLEYVGHSYAPYTALPDAKRAAREIIGSSDDSAVQMKILALLAE